MTRKRTDATGQKQSDEASDKASRALPAENKNSITPTFKSIQRRHKKAESRENSAKARTLPEDTQNLTDTVEKGDNVVKLRRAYLRRDTSAGNDNYDLELRRIINLDGFKSYRDNPKFQKYARSHSWASRSEMGYPKRGTDVFEFVHDLYSAWIGHGLVQSDLKADPGVYAQFQRRLSELRQVSMIPDWVEKDLPKERSEAALEALIADPIARAKVQGRREYSREKTAQSRARKLRSAAVT